MRKLLFFSAFAALSVLNCSGDSDAPCLSCDGSSSSRLGSSSITGSGGSSSSAGSSGGSCSINGGTVKIGNQTWMSENLNCDVSGSKCVGTTNPQTIEVDSEIYTYYLLEDKNTANCDKYGRLYDWATAMALPSSCNSGECASQISAKHRGVCPSGWHIPSNADWNVLMKFVNPDCSDNGDCAGAGTKLKATSGWNVVNGIPKGTDDYGFAALPGGHVTDGSFYVTGISSIYIHVAAGDNSRWWSASERNASSAYFRSMNSDRDDTRTGRDYKSLLFSVRCVKD